MLTDVISTADKFKRALAAHDLQAEKSLIAAYQGLYARVRDLTDALILEIANAGDSVTMGQVRHMDRYKRLMSTITNELTDYKSFVKTEIGIASSENIVLGESNARAMVAVSLGNSSIAGKFNVLNPEVIRNLLGFLSPEGELYKRLDKLPGFVADNVSQAIIDGVGLGMNPKNIARGITNAFGMGLTDSMRMMRTVQLWSYRESNRASYNANSDIVRGWLWYADIGGKACASCIAMHGTEHPLSEPLTDHWNGGCSMLPITIGEKVNIQSGEDWFTQQSAEYQKQSLGAGKYEAWKDGKFEFSQLSSEKHDDVYGTIRVETSLSDLLSQ